MGKKPQTLLIPIYIVLLYYMIQTKSMTKLDTRQQCALTENLLVPGFPGEVMVIIFHVSLKQIDFWLLNDKEKLQFCRPCMCGRLCNVVCC